MKRIVSTDDAPAAVGAYSQATGTDPPARSAVEVANLPKGVGIEIEAVATR